MRKLQPSESQIQQTFVEWCRLNEKNYPGLDLAFAVPNQSNRHIANAVRMRKEGLRAGVPDWMLPHAKLFGFVPIGLAIEFKSKSGKLTDAQFKYQRRLKEEDWEVHTCRSIEEAIDVVREYYGSD